MKQASDPVTFMRLGRADTFGSNEGEATDVTRQIGRGEDQTAATRAQNFLNGLAMFDQLLGGLEAKLPGEQQIHMVVAADRIVSEEAVRGQSQDSSQPNAVESGEIWKVSADNHFAGARYDFDPNHAMVHAWDLRGQSNALLSVISTYRVTNSDILETLNSRIDQVVRVYYKEPIKKIRFHEGRKKTKVVFVGS